MSDLTTLRARAAELTEAVNASTTMADRIAATVAIIEADGQADAKALVTLRAQVNLLDRTVTEAAEALLSAVARLD